MARTRKKSLEFSGEGLGLTIRDFDDVAKRLFCDPAAIRAVAEVESGARTGFLKDKRPKILFESRWFAQTYRRDPRRKAPRCFDG
jgi:hypothetical protein